ncbi:MAG: hypothetical protein R6X19_02645 [Kiritimatiellia bacterium]
MKRLIIAFASASALSLGAVLFAQVNTPPENVNGNRPATNAVEEPPSSDWRHPAPPGVGFLTGGVSRVKGPAAKIQP